MRADFLEPKFVGHAYNTTVRRGERKHYSVGDDYDMYKTGEETPVAHGVITGLYFCRFEELPEWVFDLEHDPSCHHYPGLLKAMLRAYPDFKENELVTVVEYWVE